MSLLHSWPAVISRLHNIRREARGHPDASWCRGLGMIVAIIALRVGCVGAYCPPSARESLRSRMRGQSSRRAFVRAQHAVVRRRSWIRARVAGGADPGPALTAIRSIKPPEFVSRGCRQRCLRRRFPYPRDLTSLIIFAAAPNAAQRT